MKTKLLKKLRKEAKKKTKFILEKIYFKNNKYDIDSYMGRFHYICFNGSNTYLEETCLNIYIEYELKKAKQKFIDNSVYSIVKYMKFKKRQRLFESIKKKLNKF